MTVTSQGTVFSGFYAYLGLVDWSPPFTDWTLRGNVRVSFFISNDVLDRTHVGFGEISPDCTSLSGFVGLWGGSTWYPPDDAYFLTNGEAAYLMRGRLDDQGSI